MPVKLLVGLQKADIAEEMFTKKRILYIFLYKFDCGLEENSNIVGFVKGWTGINVFSEKD